MMDHFKCPRSLSIEQAADYWREDSTCSYCGSLKPSVAMDRLEAGEQLGTTDKSYKMYVGPTHQKTYFQHFSQEEQARFVQLVNENKIVFNPPGGFYVLPFFLTLVPNQPL